MESQKQVQKVLKGYKDKTIKGLKEYLGMNENKINTLISSRGNNIQAGFNSSLGKRYGDC